MAPTETPDILITELRRAAMFEPGERVLVAVSGGADSTALLVALREEGVDVVAAHYDHALQAGSMDAARHVARLCEELGVGLVSERRSVSMPRGSTQAAARELRYEFLERARVMARASTIALAHTADDLVEGAVLHMLRGCGIAGLRGMPARRGAFRRPMLEVWRVDVTSFLRRRGIAALEDPANSNPRFARVRMRSELLPVLERDRPGITRRLHAAAKRAAAVQERIAGAAAQTLDGARDLVPAIRELPAPVAAECMRMLYRRAGGAEPGLGRRHIDAMLRLVASGRGGRGLDLPGGIRFRVVGSRVEVLPRVVPFMEPRIEAVECPGCDDPAAVHLRAGLQLRLAFRVPGMRMHLRAGTRKLQDVLVDARVPREERDAWPLVLAGDRIAWVPGVAVDEELESRPGEPSLHVTVTRILAAGAPKSPC